MSSHKNFLEFKSANGGQVSALKKYNKIVHPFVKQTYKQSLTLCNEIQSIPPILVEKLFKAIYLFINVFMKGSFIF